MSINPYEPPQTIDVQVFPPGAPGGVLRVEGKLLLAPSGTVLPPFCVKSNQPVEQRDYRTYSFSWAPSWVMFLILVNLLVLALVYFLVRKKCKLTYALHPNVRRKYRRRFLVKLAFVGVALALLTLLSLNQGTTEAILATAGVSVLAVFVLAVGNDPLYITAHKNGVFSIQGCSPAFLAMVRETYEPPTL